MDGSGWLGARNCFRCLSVAKDSWYSEEGKNHVRRRWQDGYDPSGPYAAWRNMTPISKRTSKDNGRRPPKTQNYQTQIEFEEDK